MWERFDVLLYYVFIFLGEKLALLIFVAAFFRDF